MVHIKKKKFFEIKKNKTLRFLEYINFQLKKNLIYNI